MNITCLHCGKKFNLLEARMDEELREGIKLLPKFGGYQRLAMEYVELFGTTPLRIKTKKLLRLLTQVATFFESGQFDFKRRSYRISRRGVAEALNITCNHISELPITDHNYLKAVMKSIAEREAREQSIAKEKKLKKKEELLQVGIKPGQAPNEEGQEEMSVGDWKRKEGIESLADRVGKTLG